MSKQKKKKTEKSNQISPARPINPIEFFKKIGLSRLSPDQHDRAFTKAGADVIRNYYACNANLNLAKIWWSGDFDKICLIANQLAELNVPPNSKVLDIGGGPGHIAFWLDKAWDNCEFTVADKFPKVGAQWAKEIGTEKVNFIDSYLPALKDIQDLQYDVVLLSRVLRNIKDLDLPSLIVGPCMETYLNGDQGKYIISALENIANSISRVLKNDGRVIILDFWSDDEIFLVSKAFERMGLLLNLDRSIPRLVTNYSIIVLSKVVEEAPLFDQPLALSTAVSTGNYFATFHGIAAESIRNMFGSATPPMVVLEHFNNEHSVFAKNEVIERDGLVLYYRSTTRGLREAVITTAFDIPRHIEQLKKYVEDLVSAGKGKIIQQIFPH